MNLDADLSDLRESGPLLAFGTSTQWCCVALRWRDALGRLRCDALAERAGQEHSRRALAMARALLEGAHLRLRDLRAIAFDAGPGSFTGLRIGCGIAQGLGFALDRPVIPVPSLEALATQTPIGTALVAVDARMDEVYCAAYRVERVGASALGALRVLAPEAAADTLLAQVDDAQRVVAIGDGFVRYGVLAEAMRARAIPISGDRYPRCDAIAAAGWRRLARGEAPPASQAAPVYVREKVALDVDEQRRLRAGRASTTASPMADVGVTSAGRG